MMELFYGVDLFNIFSIPGLEAVNIPLQTPINGNQVEVGSSGWNIANIVYNSLENIYNFIWPGTVIDPSITSSSTTSSSEEVIDPSITSSSTTSSSEEVIESTLEFLNEQSRLWHRAKRTPESVSSSVWNEASYSSLSKEDHFVYHGSEEDKKDEYAWFCEFKADEELTSKGALKAFKAVREAEDLLQGKLDSESELLTNLRKAEKALAWARYFYFDYCAEIMSNNIT